MALFFRKKIERKDIFALILGALGVFTMLNIWSFSHEEIFSQKNIYFVLASILWPILTIVSSKATKISPMVFTFYMYVITTIMVMVFFVDVPNISYKEFDWIFWLNVLSISIISTTFATTLYFVGIEKLGTNEVSSFIFLVPLFAIILSVIFLKENISLSIIVGTILTLIAVKILNNIKIFKKSK
jgi:drug/metabolite transporter (DMT)-like permease